MSGLDMPPEVMGRYLALIDLIGRTGASDYRIEYTDPDNGVVMWIAIAQHHQRNGKPIPSAGAGATPLQATHVLAELLIDDGTCTHCGRATVLEDFCSKVGDRVGFTALVSGDVEVQFCWYQFDPELRTYRRSCEGETAANPLVQK